MYAKLLISLNLLMLMVSSLARVIKFMLVLVFTLLCYYYRGRLISSHAFFEGGSFQAMLHSKAIHFIWGQGQVA